MNVAEYHWGTYNNHQPKRDRKLLLTKRELRKLSRQVQESSLTIVGLKLFINERGFAKVEIGLAQGRKQYDKREYIKEKDAKREMARMMKH
jgi:SsrA-binding protein